MVTKKKLGKPVKLEAELYEILKKEDVNMTKFVSDAVKEKRDRENTEKLNLAFEKLKEIALKDIAEGQSEGINDPDTYLKYLITKAEPVRVKKLEEEMKEVKEKLEYFAKEYEMEEKIQDDPIGFKEKARRELREIDPEVADAYDKVEELHRKHKEKLYSKLTPKQRKEIEDDKKRIGKKLQKERKEKRSKLFKK